MLERATFGHTVPQSAHHWRGRFFPFQSHSYSCPSSPFCQVCRKFSPHLFCMPAEADNSIVSPGAKLNFSSGNSRNGFFFGFGICPYCCLNSTSCFFPRNCAIYPPFLVKSLGCTYAIDVAQSHLLSFYQYSNGLSFGFSQKLEGLFRRPPVYSVGLFLPISRPYTPEEGCTIQHTQCDKTTTTPTLSHFDPTRLTLLAR